MNALETTWQQQRDLAVVLASIQRWLSQVSPADLALAREGLLGLHDLEIKYPFPQEQNHERMH